MKAVYSLGVAAAVAVCLSLPQVGLAAGGPKTLTGVVSKIAGNQITFTNGTAASYLADTGSAVLTRKNGSPMLLSEIILGDKVQVTGTLYSDNSVGASAVRDMSLYAHSGTFSGKITAINPTAQSFTMQGTTYGVQNIGTNQFTSFTSNGSAATFKDLQLGMSVSVKGLWDRSRANVVAGQVKGTLRMISITFSGSISAVNGQALTVIGNGNVIYGVDLSKAKLENKSSADISLSAFKTGDKVEVAGKHISGSVQIVGTTVKDASLTK